MKDKIKLEVTTSQANFILDATNSSATDSSIWNNSAPNATNFTVGSSTSTNGNDDTYICYAFGEK